MATSTFTASPEIKQEAKLEVTRQGREEKTAKSPAVSFSHFHKLTTFLQSDPLGNNEDCIATSTAVVHLLTKKPYIFQKPYRFPITLFTKPEQPITPTHLPGVCQSYFYMGDKNTAAISQCAFTDFFANKKTRHSLLTKISDLLAFTQQPEHSIYHIILGRKIHAFVIEKISNKTKVSYRVYQSWILKFNLEDGIQQQPEMDRESLLKFFSSLKDPCTDVYDNRITKTPTKLTNTAIITKHPFEPSTLDFLLTMEQNKSENCQLKEEDIEKISNKTLRRLLSS